jgi:hypothetical protein
VFVLADAVGHAHLSLPSMMAIRPPVQDMQPQEATHAAAGAILPWRQVHGVVATLEPFALLR